MIFFGNLCHEIFSEILKSLKIDTCQQHVVRLHLASLLWRKPPLGLDGLNYLNSDCIRQEVKERISELGAVREWLYSHRGSEFYYSRTCTDFCSADFDYNYIFSVLQYFNIFSKEKLFRMFVVKCLYIKIVGNLFNNSSKYWLEDGFTEIQKIE